jgi:SAM-dependent methyltransferase
MTGSGTVTTIEERAEAERHDRLYRSSRPSTLRMPVWDWEKFGALGAVTNAYHASVKRLGDIRGLWVLDAGCGDGWLSVILAKLGARVDGFDISREAVATARHRAEANGTAGATRFNVASFYSLPYADASFDIVIGQAVLHHLRDKQRAAAQLHRVMRAGARAVFCEPFGDSLWLERLRLLVPVPSGAPDDPTQWSEQFKYRDLEAFRDLFDVEIQEFQLLSRLDRVVRSPRFVAWLGRLDLRLLQTIPRLRRYARTIVVELTRRGTDKCARARSDAGRG